MTETMKMDQLSLLARQIEEHAQQSDEHLVKAAALMAEARRRVEAGEAGDTTWSTWAPKNINLSESRLRELQRIAKANDPAEELARQREQTRKRVERHREKKAAERHDMEPARNRLIKWAMTAPIEQVRRLLEQIPSNDNEARPAGGKPGSADEAAA